MFLFLKYIQPTWYYRLSDRMPAPVLADIHRLDTQQVTLIRYDDGYGDEAASRMDAAYQGLVNGVIPSPSQCIPREQVHTIVSLAANYRFVRKFFATHWYAYTYLLRLCTGHNIFRETHEFIRHWRVPRVAGVRHLGDSLKGHELRECPFVTVVIPTLNRYPYLKDVLSDLDKQDYRHFEVLVCDQSEPVDESFYQGWDLDLTLLKQEEKALWLARNTCIQRAKGSHILLFDDDSRVEVDWIRNHLACLERFDVSISAGVTHTLVGHGLGYKDHYFHLSDVFDTGNAMVKKEVFYSTGLFDRQFERQRMGDAEFGLRALLSGFPIVSNPQATRVHLKVETGGLRQMGSWDALRPRNFLAPRPVPSVLYYIRKYFGNGNALLYILSNVPFSFIHYKLKSSKPMKMAALLILPLFTPLMVVAALRAWWASDKKLVQGPKVVNLI